MHRLIVTHKKPSCASQSSARASAIAEQYSALVNGVFLLIHLIFFLV